MDKEAVREARRQRIAELREDLDMLMREELDDQSASLLERCHRLIADNCKVAAMKLYRDETGVGLVEAASYLGIIQPRS